MKKLLVVGMIVLFLGLAIAPSISSESSAVLSKLPLDEEEIYYYNPQTLTHTLGLCESWQSAIRLTPDELSPYQDWNLTKITVKTSIDHGQTEIWADLIIYAQGSASTPGSIIYQDNGLYFNSTGFQITHLKEPISLNDHSELWISFDWKQKTNGSHPGIIFCDDGPSTPLKGCWLSYNHSSAWNELSDYGLDYNWAIGAILEGVGKAELSITNIIGLTEVIAEIKNIGEYPAYNIENTMIVNGGILGRIHRITSNSIIKLAPDETVHINSDLIFGLGLIDVRVTSNSSNAYEVSTSKSGLIFGPFVFIFNLI